MSSSLHVGESFQGFFLLSLYFDLDFFCEKKKNRNFELRAGQLKWKCIFFRYYFNGSLLTRFPLGSGQTLEGHFTECFNNNKFDLIEEAQKSITI